MFFFVFGKVAGFFPLCFLAGDRCTVPVHCGLQVAAHPVLGADFHHGVFLCVFPVAVIAQGICCYVDVERGFRFFCQDVPPFIVIDFADAGRIPSLVVEGVVSGVPSYGAAVYIVVDVQQLQDGTLAQVGFPALDGIRHNGL